MIFSEMYLDGLSQFCDSGSAQQVGINTLEDCKAECLRRLPACPGIDFDMSNTCYLTTPGPRHRSNFLSNLHTLHAELPNCR